MSDLCMQCALEIWGEDSGDLATGESEPTTVLCEGCGWCEVDGEGRCLTHPHDEICHLMWGWHDALPDGTTMPKEDEP